MPRTKAGFSPQPAANFHHHCSQIFCLKSITSEAPNQNRKEKVKATKSLEVIMPQDYQHNELPLTPG